MSKYHKVKKDENTLHIHPEKREFKGTIKIKSEDVVKCLKFSNEMTFGGAGKQRRLRTNGTHVRESGEEFLNIFSGKLAECAFRDYCKNNNQPVTEVDFTPMDLGEWDKFDVKVNNYFVAIKSCANFANLLLLEKDMYTSDGAYIPNIDTEYSKYDFFVLVRLKPDAKSMIKETFETQKFNESNLNQVIASLNETKWVAEITGCISLKSFVEDIINSNDGEFIIYKGNILGKNTVMDVDNYYVQAIDLDDCKQIFNK